MNQSAVHFLLYWKFFYYRKSGSASYYYWVLLNWFLLARQWLLWRNVQKFL